MQFRDEFDPFVCGQRLLIIKMPKFVDQLISETISDYNIYGPIKIYSAFDKIKFKGETNGNRRTKRSKTATWN